jgi:hypothetical protein
MIIDRSLLLCDSVSTTTTHASTNYIDTLKAGPGAYVGSYFVVVCEAAFTGGTSVEFKVEEDTDSGFATAMTTLVSLGVQVIANLGLGTVLAVRLPFKNTKRYLRAYATIVGVQTGGTYSAFLAKDVDLKQP